MIRIIYWTGTGNTGSMARYIAQGILEEGKEVEVKEVGETTREDVTGSELVLLGCPAMGSEELEDIEMEPFIESLVNQIQDQKMVLFGSYGWGNGEWMETWTERMVSYGANIVHDPLIINEFTTGQDEEICKSFGQDVAGL